MDDAQNTGAAAGPGQTLKTPRPGSDKAGSGCLPIGLAVILGLLLPVLIWGLLYLYHRPNLEKPHPAAKALELQKSVLKSLEEEIELHRQALEKDPCDPAPPAWVSPFDARLPGAAPPNTEKDGQTPGQGSASKPAQPIDHQPGQAPPATLPPTESPQSVGELLERATVLVVAPAANQAGTSMGSGFFIAPNLIMTNNHVISGPNGGEGRILVTNKILGTILSARLVATVTDDLRDYAVLEVNPPPGRQPSVLEFAPPAKRTDRVSAWGFPTLLTETDPNFQALLSGQASATPEVVYTEGVVSVVQMQGSVPVISHTAEVSPGNSGGPLVNEKGLVVGINTFIKVDSKSNRQVNAALGSSDILSFIKEQGLIR